MGEWDDFGIWGGTLNKNETLNKAYVDTCYGSLKQSHVTELEQKYVIHYMYWNSQRTEPGMEKPWVPILQHMFILGAEV